MQEPFVWGAEEKTTSPGCQDAHGGCLLLPLPGPPKTFPGCGTSLMLWEAVRSVEPLEKLKIKIGFQRAKSDLTT